MDGSGLSGLEYFFLTSAVIGGVIVLVKLVIQFIAGSDSDLGTDDVGGHPDDGFKMLSLQGIGAFFLLFGLVGLAMLRESKAGVPFSVVVALLAGFAAVWAIARLFGVAKRLQSSGTVSVEEMAGKKATVYLHIPKNGTGTVTVHFSGRSREYDAREITGKAVPTGETVLVKEVSGNILLVEAGK